MGGDRGTRARGAAQNGYPRDRDYGYGDRYNDDWRANGRDAHYGRDMVDSKYDHASKYDDRGVNGRRDENSHGGRNGDTGHMPIRNGNGHSDALPEAAIASLEKKIENVAQETTQAISDATSKENEKFELIMSILQELQRRQGELEENVRQLRSRGNQQYGGMQGNGQYSSNGNYQGNQMGNQMGNHMNNQGASQGQNGQMYMQNQMQYGGMVNGDGSQPYFNNGQGMPQNVMVIAQPVGMPPPQGGQMVQQVPYGGQMQMISGPMQPQMGVQQYANQDQSGGNFQQQQQWNGQQEPPAKSDGTQEESLVTQMNKAGEEAAAEEGDQKVAIEDGSKAEIRIEEE